MVLQSLFLKLDKQQREVERNQLLSQLSLKESMVISKNLGICFNKHLINNSVQCQKNLQKELKIFLHSYFILAKLFQDQSVS